MSTTDKLANALRNSWGLNPVFEYDRKHALAEYDASQSTPAGEVTADAVQLALDAWFGEHWVSDDVAARKDMQAALAAAFPGLLGKHQENEEYKAMLRNQCSRLIAERDNLSVENARHEAKITGMVAWLEQNQNDVFSRGLWDAINAATAQAKQAEGGA